MPQTIDQLYFAYGSNLHLQQMAKRCPNSKFVGRAVLLEYKWQINQRGFANVVPRSGYSVHGLVYALGDGDEARLDRNEGVSTRAYSKAYKPVVMYSSPHAPQYMTQQIVDAGSPGILEADEGTCSPWVQGDVLVYISEDYVQKGRPRDEYIDRMNLGIRDASALGIPRDFIHHFLRYYIPDRPPLVEAQNRQRTRTPILHPTETPPISSAGRVRRVLRRSLSEASRGRWRMRDDSSDEHAVIASGSHSRWEPSRRQSPRDTQPLPRSVRAGSPTCRDYRQSFEMVDDSSAEHAVPPTGSQSRWDVGRRQSLRDTRPVLRIIRVGSPNYRDYRQSSEIVHDVPRDWQSSQ